MSFPTVYYITQVIPPCYSAGYTMCVCVRFSACVSGSQPVCIGSLDMNHQCVVKIETQHFTMILRSTF